MKEQYGQYSKSVNKQEEKKMKKIVTVDGMMCKRKFDYKKELLNYC